MSDLVERATAKATWGAPRFAEVESFVRDLAFRLDLDVWTQVDKGWLTERGRVRVTGDADACREFMRILNAAMERFNHD